MVIKTLLLALTLVIADNNSEKICFDEKIDASADLTLYVATTQSKESPMGKLMLAWGKRVSEKSNGELRIKFHFEGALGDEEEIVSKLLSGQLDGAALTSDGLGHIYKPITALEMPGLQSDTVSLNQTIRNGMTAFRREFSKKDVILSAITSSFTYVFSKSAIHLPSDLQTKKIGVYSNSEIAMAMSQTIGYTTVRESVPGIKSALSAERINVIFARPADMANYLWHSHLNYVNLNPVAVEIRGLVFSQKQLDKLPPHLLQIINTTTSNLSAKWSKALKKADQQAEASYNLSKITPTNSEKSEWSKEFSQVREKLGENGVYSTTWINNLENGL